MQVLRLIVLSSMLALAACTSAGVETTTTPATGETTTTSTTMAEPTPTVEDTTTTTTVSDTTVTTSDRPLAPDFTLELGDGGTYTLSEGARPVYLVFWAEW